MCVDILGPFPITDHRNRYVLVAMDYFTKWPEVSALPDQSDITTAERLVSEMFCHFGASEELHSDQAKISRLEYSPWSVGSLGSRRPRQHPCIPRIMG